MSLKNRRSIAMIALSIGICLGQSAPAASAAELLMFEEAGCPWCMRWNQEIGVIYDRTTEGRRAPLHRVNIHARPADLAHVKIANFTPTFVLISGNREVGRILGYAGEDFFWPTLNDLLAKVSEPNSNSDSDQKARPDSAPEMTDDEDGGC